MNLPNLFAPSPASTAVMRAGWRPRALRRDLPGIIAETLREVLRERDR